MQYEISPHSEAIYRALARAILLATGIFLLFWFLYQALLAILFALVAFILALALNPPVSWLEKRGLNRIWATLVVILAALVVVAGLGMLVVPRLLEQLTTLAANAPTYTQQLNERALRWLHGYPDLQSAVDRFLNNDRALLSRAAPILQDLLTRCRRIYFVTTGSYSLHVPTAYNGDLHSGSAPPATAKLYPCFSAAPAR